MTPFWLYVEQEGGTSGGTFTPFQDAAGNPLPAFKGYPKKTTNNVPTPSPYFLPYAPSEGPVYVGQGNQGLFSHNAGNVGQLYSYDFSVDAKTELLAARAGTVVAFSEAIPDNVNGPFGAFNTTLRTAIAAGPGPSTIDVQSTANFLAPGILQIGGTTAFFTSIPDANTFAGVTWTSGTAPNVAAGQGVQQNVFGWNFVAIRHDTLDGTHDLGPGGVAMTTIATYGHGANGGVSAAFARHTPAVATNAILGTVVKQGMPIMDSDSTGISFCNHVHMHVVQFLAATNFLQWGGINNPAFTIPFIFQDVGGDGVCTHFNWYTSGNARVLV
jgi:hypothetical protein